MKLPAGVLAIQDSATFKYFEDIIPIKNFTISNDTAIYILDASGVTFLNGEYRMRLGFTADCAAVPGESSFPINMSFYCPSCDCRNEWYNDTIRGPRIHYLDPPCPPNPNL
ncbi:MAG: hypothetical protein HC817_13625 [Saprospiraceae bacterium]|nr:hypothetical protein [Saprospiraceae bacterium]